MHMRVRAKWEGSGTGGEGGTKGKGGEGQARADRGKWGAEGEQTAVSSSWSALPATLESCKVKGER